MNLIEILNFKPLRLHPESAWTAHLPFANALVKSEKPELFVELGTHYGESYFGFCQAIRDSKLNTLCYAIDSWQGDLHAGELNNDVFKEVQAYNEEYYRDFSYLLHGFFDDYIKQFQDRSIDILHIDGFHSYEASKHDFESWLPKVKQGGFILLHDVCVREKDFGVWKLWQEISKNYESYTFQTGYGLGIIRLSGGKELENSHIFKQLLNNTPNIEKFLTHAGETLLNRKLTNCINDKLKEKCHDLEKYKKIGDDKEIEIERCLSDIKALQKEASKQNKNLETLAADNELLRNHIAIVEKEHVSKRFLLQQSKQKIDELLQALEAKNATIRELENRYNELKDSDQEKINGYIESEIDLKAQIKDLSLQYNDARIGIKNQDEEIHKLQQQSKDAHGAWIRATEDLDKLKANHETSMDAQDKEIKKLQQQSKDAHGAWVRATEDLDKLKANHETSMEAQDKEIKKLQQQSKDAHGAWVRATEDLNKLKANHETSMEAQDKEIKKLQQQSKDAHDAWVRATEELNILSTTHNTLAEEHSQLGNNHSNVCNELDALQQAHNELIHNHNLLKIRNEQASDKIHRMSHSFSWNATSPFRALRRLKDKYLKKKRATPSNLTHTKTPQKVNGKKQFIRSTFTPFESWQEFNKPTAFSLKKRLDALESNLTDSPPLFSILVPVYKTEASLLTETISSVQNQIYKNWELCIVDDGSNNAELSELLLSFEAQDSRIHIQTNSKNQGISAATNDAASMAKGDFLVFLDHDDLLVEDALLHIFFKLLEAPTLDFIYSDHDKISMDGVCYDPEFKPSYSPELLLSFMYLGHVKTIRKSIYSEIGGMRIGFEGSQDYDLALRVFNKTNKIAHIPKILYHWRASPNSTAQHGEAKPEAFSNGLKALQEIVEQQNPLAKATQPEWALKAGCGIYSTQFPDTGPSVTIIIPTFNNYKLLKQCIDSIEKTTYENFKVLIIDNASDDPKTLAYLSSLEHKVISIPSINNQFNFSYLNNQAVKHCKSDYLLFLNNDIEIIAPNWLSQMIGYGMLKNVGAVGARLLFPNHKIQHAGIIHGLHNIIPGHAFKNQVAGESGYMSFAKVTRNYSAVTGACLLTPRELFLDAGGFDEKDFGVAFNDVDYCYRLLENGYRSVYCPDAELFHHENGSRDGRLNPIEVRNFKQKYSHFDDIYYNPNLALTSEHFDIKPYSFPFKSNKPLKLLAFTHNLRFEGAPLTQFEILVELVHKKNWSITVISYEGGPLKSLYESAGIGVHVIVPPFVNKQNIETYDQDMVRYQNECKIQDFDLVYANTLPLFCAIDAAHQAECPSVWVIHESEDWKDYFKYLPHEIENRALNTLHTPYRVIFVSEATKATYRSIDFRQNFDVIVNGLNLKRFKEIDAKNTPSPHVSDNIKILCLGTVCKRKGQMDLVEAFPQLPTEIKERIEIIIVGDRDLPYSKAILERVKHFNTEDQEKITLVKETNSVEDYYQAADIFVCCSRIESYPRVILEAMTFGLPIITTPAFGIKEQVNDGYNAFFYEPGETKQLAEKLKLMIEDNDLRKRFGAQSRIQLDSLNSFDTMISQYEKVFQEAASSSSPN